jgi:zinc finger and BTB domain-containing protein 41
MKIISVCTPIVSDDCNGTNFFKCRFCDIVFTSALDLDKHSSFDSDLVSESGSEESNLRCKICNQEFLTYRGMRQHYGKIHHNLKKIKCKFCSKRFKDNYAVKYHRKQVHEKSTQVQCFLCAKSIYNKFSLKKHFIACSEKFFQVKTLEKIIN